MHQLLKLKQTVQLANHTPCTVDQFLGGGGQGEVYRATVSGKPVALKWYFPEQATPEQKAALEALVKLGAPNSKFLWPLELASANGVKGFGYIMPLREARYKSLFDLMKRRAEPSFHNLITACYQLADSFYQLHAKGLCYRDISHGNIFFDPKTGEVLICDNDNVAPNGQDRVGVYGTPRFMAPEIVRGEAKPSTQTDLFSLAVLLFYMLMMHHPLEGKKEADIKAFDLPAMNKIYGKEPVFIFDPQDNSNRPVAGYQDNALIYWPLYPAFLQDLFIRAFVDGVRSPDRRVRESEWRGALIRLRDSIVYCGHCKAENFYDAAKGSQPVCWACKKPVTVPVGIRIGSSVVMLNAQTSLYPHHLDSTRPYDFSTPWAVVQQHPQNPNLWGLKNLTASPWQVVTPDGRPAVAEPQRSVSLAKGTRIQFGMAEGEIC